MTNKTCIVVPQAPDKNICTHVGFFFFFLLICFFLFGHWFTNGSLGHGAVRECCTAAGSIAQFIEAREVLDATRRSTWADLVTSGSGCAYGPPRTCFEASCFCGAKRPSSAGSVPGSLGSSSRATPFARPAWNLFFL